MRFALFQQLHSSQYFVSIFIGVTLFRIWFATALPITGDEAYFIEWGRQPDWGFYDHPPMVGWWLSALLYISEKSWWLRLPQLLQPTLVACMLLYTLSKITKGEVQEKSNILMMLVLLQPTNLLNVLITTDTPLVYFSVASGLAWLLAENDKQRRLWYWICGVALSGAVLSKFFAVLIGAAFFYDTVRHPQKDKLVGFGIVCLCCIPSLALLFYWNSHHCWTNYLFNFVNRHSPENSHLNILTPALYILVLFYAYTPPVLLSFVKSWRRPIQNANIGYSLTYLTFLPLIFFGILSFIKKIGLHWIFAFIPFGLLYLTLKTSLENLRRIKVFFIGFALIQMLAVITISRMPLETWRSLSCYPSIVLEFAYKDILKHVAENEVLTTASYSKSAVLTHYAQQYVPVFGMGSSHARQDDIFTDWRALNGGNISVLLANKPARDDYLPYFNRIKVESFMVRGFPFWLMHGEGFRAKSYQRLILEEVKNRYYILPTWLPTFQCYFCTRYF